MQFLQIRWGGSESPEFRMAREAASQLKMLIMDRQAATLASG